jgi:hypothetical protein
MAFPNQTPGTFTVFGVQSIQSGLIGCYGIYRPGQWIYVGKSEADIRGRLVEHLWDRRILNEYPTNFVIELTPNAVDREERLILELGPLLNQRIG